MFQAVIFDRDGVLLDFDLEAAAAYFDPLLPIPLDELIVLWREYGRQAGFPETLSQERAFWQGLWNYVANKLKLDAGTTAQLHQFDYTSILFPYPDAESALQFSKARGMRTAVLSNFSLASIESSLQATGLAEWVDVAAAAMVIGAAKPERAAYDYVLQALSVAPENCLLFDNKLRHVQGGRALGLQAYLVDRSRTAHDLASGIVRDLSALSAILEGTEPSRLAPA